MRRQTFNEINITPLTDIFLVLLIIMMVIAPMLDQQGLNLAIPDFVEEQNDNKNTKILNIVVTMDNKYFIDDEEISEKDLFNTLKSKVSEYPDGLMIQAEGDSQHGCVVKLMDNARNAGVKSISIMEI